MSKSVFDTIMDEIPDIDLILKKTVNHYGFMSLVESPDFRLGYKMMNKSRPVLDIGCAYGFTSKIMLAAGLDVIANDLDDKHLSILAEEVNAGKYTGKLTLQPGNVLELDIADGTLGGIVCLNVVHFFDGDQVRRFFDKVHAWLAKDGVLVLTVASPTMANNNLADKYYEDLRSGIEWPGQVHTSSLSGSPVVKNIMPSTFHFNSLETIMRETLRVGLKVFKASYSSKGYTDATELSHQLLTSVVLSK